MRWIAACLVGLAAIVAACGGGDGDGPGIRNEEALTLTVEEVTVRLLDPDTPLRQIEGYLATECREDFNSGGVLFTRGVLEDLIGDAEVTVEVTSIEFIGDDRALVESRLLVDGEPFALPGGDEDEESSLWVLQDGQWYGADDCEFFGTRRELGRRAGE